MSDEKIDVLAVMDRLIGNTRMVAGMTGDPAVRAHLLEGEQARAAVAELIEAAHWSIAQTRANQSDGLVPTIYYSAHQRLIAALARVRSS